MELNLEPSGVTPQRALGSLGKFSERLGPRHKGNLRPGLSKSPSNQISPLHACLQVPDSSDTNGQSGGRESSAASSAPAPILASLQRLRAPACPHPQWAAVERNEAEELVTTFHTHGGEAGPGRNLCSCCPTLVASPCLPRPPVIFLLQWPPIISDMLLSLPQQKGSPAFTSSGSLLEASWSPRPRTNPPFLIPLVA